MEDYKKIFNFSSEIPNRIISREGSRIEFKESYNWHSRCKYAKSIAAFANTKGGFIVFGVKNKPKDLVGLQNDNFEETDEAKMTEYLNSAFSPEINFEKLVIEVKRKKIGLLYIYQSENKPIVCIKNDNEIKEADIYYRYNARSEKIKYPELKILFEQIQERERKSWMDHFAKISKIGSSNVAILDVLNGKINGQGGTLVIDEKLVPKLKFIKEGNFRQKGWPTLRLVGDVRPVSVTGHRARPKKDIRITDDPSAPEIRVREETLLKKYPLDYRKLVEKLRSRYIDFKLNQRFHQFKRQFKKKGTLCHTRCLDPDNPKSSKKDFYSLKIIKEFDKHYKLRKRTKKTKIKIANKKKK